MPATAAARAANLYFMEPPWIGCLGCSSGRKHAIAGAAVGSRVNPSPPFFGVLDRRRCKARAAEAGRGSRPCPRRELKRRIGDTAEPAPLVATMFVRGLGIAIPSRRYTKAQCLEAFERSDWFARLDSRSHMIARLVLQRDHGIESRHLALESLDDVFNIDPDTLDRRFLANAPALASEAGAKALAAAGLAAQEIDAVVISTCTGYLCPGLSGYVVERLGLRADVQAYD